MRSGLDGIVFFIGLLHIGFIKIVLLFVKRFRARDFIGGRLFAGGEKFFQSAAGFVGVLHESIGQDGVGMADHAGGGVRKIANVAIFDEQFFTVANEGDMDGLSGGDTG